jgi:hypothetical protein
MNQHLVTTLPSRSTCNRCRRPVLCGLDAGMPYSVDLVPMNVLGELTARLSERCTYRLRGGFVMYRGLSDIRAGTSDPVIAAHACELAPIDHINPAHLETLARYLIPHDVADPTVLRTLVQPDLFTSHLTEPPF